MIAVCEECHESDKSVIECNSEFKNHANKINEGVCEICGKLKPLVGCYQYGQYIIRRA